MLGKAVVFSVLVLGLAYYLQSGSDNKVKLIRDGKVVQTNTGAVKGSILASRDGRDYYAWYRIPYAKPPLGDLRFADPLPVENWTEVIDGREEGPECAQVNFMSFGPSDVFGSEDCLQLNVFVPKQHLEDIIQGKSPKLPVIVYIHGGAYIGGSSRMGSGKYFMDEDVILVTLNYRLEILGFLSTGDKIARGNQGLKDQTMALKWVKNNIKDFGGDPNQIAIFGTSAGAASVHQQTLSPLSKGLFQRAFAQSGAASNTWGLLTLKRSIEKTKEVAETLSCPTNDHRALVDCLRKIDTETLLKQRLNAVMNEYLGMKPNVYGDAFVPTVEAVKDEHAFIAEHPLKIISEGKAHRVPLLVGHATHEGLGTVAMALKKDPENEAKFEDKRVPTLKRIFAIESTNVTGTADKIYEFYLPNRNQLSFDEKFSLYVDMFGDALFNLDISESVRLQRKFSPVYYYVHNKTDAPDPMGLFLEITGKWPIMVEVGWYLLKSFVKEKIFGIAPPFYGVGHAADASYYFPFEAFQLNIKKGDALYQYSKDLIKTAVQFAKDDTKMEFRGVKILPTPSEGPLQVSHFKNEEVILSQEPFKNRLEFLRSLQLRTYK